MALTKRVLSTGQQRTEDIWMTSAAGTGPASSHFGPGFLADVHTVRLWGGDHVDALEVGYVDGNSGGVGDQSGEPLMDLQLQPGERITRVCGHTKDNRIESMIIETNFRTLYTGQDKNTKCDFEFDVPDDKHFAGFHGTFGARVHSVGIVLRKKPTSARIESSDTYGNSSISLHTPNELPLSISVLSVRLLGNAGRIVGIEFTYSDRSTKTTPTTQSDKAVEITLEDGEYLVAVYGRCSADVNHLKFVSSLGQTLSLGREEGERFEFFPKIGHEVIGFTAGWSDGTIRSVSFDHRLFPGIPNVLLSPQFNAQRESTSLHTVPSFVSDPTNRVTRVTAWDDQGKLFAATPGVMELEFQFSDGKRTMNGHHNHGSHMSEDRVMAEGDYVVSVEGTIQEYRHWLLPAMITTKTVLSSLQLNTKFRQPIYTGVSQGRQFVWKAHHGWEIVACLYTESSRISSIRFVQRPRIQEMKLYESDKSGGQGTGTIYRSPKSLKRSGRRLTYIAAHTTDKVFCFWFAYNGNTKNMYRAGKATGGDLTQCWLAEDEFVRDCTIWSDSIQVHKIVLTTNKGQKVGGGSEIGDVQTPMRWSDDTEIVALNAQARDDGAVANVSVVYRERCYS